MHINILHIGILIWEEHNMNFYEIIGKIVVFLFSCSFLIVCLTILLRIIFVIWFEIYRACFLKLGVKSGYKNKPFKLAWMIITDGYWKYYIFNGSTRIYSTFEIDYEPFIPKITKYYNN